MTINPTAELALLRDRITAAVTDPAHRMLALAIADDSVRVLADAAAGRDVAAAWLDLRAQALNLEESARITVAHEVRAWWIELGIRTLAAVAGAAV